MDGTVLFRLQPLDLKRVSPGDGSRAQMVPAGCWTPCGGLCLLGKKQLKLSELGKSRGV